MQSERDPSRPLLPDWLLVSTFVGLAIGFSDMALAQTATPGHVAVDGIIAIEADHFRERVAGGSHQWVVEPTAGASEDIAVRATPDTGRLSYRETGSPRLRFAVDFPQAGTWTVWVRGRGDANARGEGKSDSVHIGLDGVLSTASAMQEFPAGQWAWSRQRRGGSNATLSVAAAGERTVDVWMREDGFVLDRIVLVQDASYVPVDAGPVDLHAGDALSVETTNGQTDEASDEASVPDGGSQSDGTAVDDSNPDSDATGTPSDDTSDTTDTDGTGSAQEAEADTDTIHAIQDGVITIEASRFDTRTDTASHRWVGGTASGSIASGSLVASPNAGRLSFGSSGSPHLQYAVDFPAAGRYVVWVRGRGDSNANNEGKNDSVHVGIDGNLSSASAIQSFPAGRWAWSKERRGGGAALVTVDSAGRHTLDVWMREDGFEFDNVQLTTSTSYSPAAAGTTDEPADATNDNHNDNDHSLIPASRDWTQRTSSNGSRLVARHEAGAVEFNGKLYLIGGRGSRVVSIFDPVGNRWTQGARPPFEMHHAQPVVVGNRIYVIGAMTCCYPRERNVPNVWTYTPATNQWAKGAAIPTARQRGGAGAVVRNGKIYLVGGNRYGHSGGAVGWFDEFDPATGRWRVLPNSPAARDHFQAALADGKLVVAGGRRSTQPNVFANTVARVDSYDFSTNRWTRLRDLPTQRAGTMTVTVGNEVVIIGGESTASSNGFSTVESLDMDTGNWQRLRPLRQGRHSGGAAVLADGIHVVAGDTRRGGGAETTSHERLALP